MCICFAEITAFIFSDKAFGGSTRLKFRRVPARVDFHSRPGSPSGSPGQLAVPYYFLKQIDHVWRPNSKTDRDFLEAFDHTLRRKESDSGLAWHQRDQYSSLQLDHMPSGDSILPT